MPTALIVIDMQQGSFSPETPRYDAEGLVRRINALAARIRDAQGMVVFVQHDGPEGDPHHPDSPGWHLLPELEVQDGDCFVRKTACDSFLSTDLEKRLRAASIQHLVVTGCATEYCVDTTVRSALARGFRTSVPADGHTTAERAHLSAPAIIAHHNATWADFISPAGPAEVRPAAHLDFTAGV